MHPGIVRMWRHVSARHPQYSELRLAHGSWPRRQQSSWGVAQPRGADGADFRPPREKTKRASISPAHMPVRRNLAPSTGRARAHPAGRSEDRTATTTSRQPRRPREHRAPVTPQERAGMDLPAPTHMRSDLCNTDDHAATAPSPKMCPSRTNLWYGPPPHMRVRSVLATPRRAAKRPGQEGCDQRTQLRQYAANAAWG